MTGTSRDRGEHGQAEQRAATNARHKLAKEWAERHNHWLFVAGLLTFGVLFAVYAASLHVAELSTVTFGWIVSLQVGLLLFERFRYAVVLPHGKWVAVVVILLLQAYLVLAPNGKPA